MKQIKSGQSIIEVVIATTLISIGVIAALSLTNQSQKSSNYAKLLDTANSYNNQLADYLRNQKALHGWGNIVEKITSDATGGYTTYCFPSLSENEDFLDKGAGPCGPTDYIPNTFFSRQVEFDARTLDSGILPATITTSWEEKGNPQRYLGLGAFTMEIKRGNSIIELTVVIGLVSLLALAMSAIMLTTLTSSNRIRRLTKIKQAGDYALTQIQTMIRNAREIISCDPDQDLLSIRNTDGGITNLQIEDNGGVDRIASNSGTYLTPNDLSTTAFSITCEPSVNDPVLFKFSFDITDPNPNLKTSENSTLHFETTTGIRNE